MRHEWARNKVGGRREARRVRRWGLLERRWPGWAFPKKSALMEVVQQKLTAMEAVVHAPVASSAFAKFLARISLYRRVAIQTPKWRYVVRGAPGERSEPQKKQGVRGQRPRDFFLQASI